DLTPAPVAVGRRGRRALVGRQLPHPCEDLARDPSRENAQENGEWLVEEFRHPTACRQHQQQGGEVDPLATNTSIRHAVTVVCLRSQLGRFLSSHPRTELGRRLRAPPERGTLNGQCESS